MTVRSVPRPSLHRQPWKATGMVCGYIPVESSFICVVQFTTEWGSGRGLQHPLDETFHKLDNSRDLAVSL